MVRKSETLTVLMIGDLVGSPGLALFQKWALPLREKYGADVVVVNGENVASNGRGIVPSQVNALRAAGADVITTGNHIWAQKQVLTCIDREERLLRPANFPSSCPGKGTVVFTAKGVQVAVVNLQGRIFMHEQVDNPFQAAESLLSYLRTRTQIILVDFHAETSSEKKGMGFFLDGKVSAVVGTHTHIQTADEHILPGGTAYITDLGCAGALYSMLGMKKDIILQRMLTQMPVKFLVDHQGPFTLHGVCIKIDMNTGKALSIERIQVLDTELIVAGDGE